MYDSKRTPVTDLQAALGAIDVYLLDQILRGRVAFGARILDAGAGGGRNLGWFLGAGFDVSALDPSTEAVAALRALVDARGRFLVPDAVRCETLEEHTFPDCAFDLVIANAVLHFARDDEHFTAMLDGAWRACKHGGVLFMRLASSIGLEGHEALGDGQYKLPDGSTRYLVDQERLLAETERLGARLLDPLKTTNVQDLRCMTTWVLERP